MAAPANNRIELLYGTLDLLILRTLVYGPSHGHAIARRIRRVSDDALQIETGSLYPALHKLEGRGWIAAEWKRSDKGKRARYYRLTPSGREHLTVQQSRWEALSVAMARVLRPAEQESGP